MFFVFLLTNLGLNFLVVLSQQKDTSKQLITHFVIFVFLEFKR